MQFAFIQREMMPRLAEAAAGRRKVLFLDAAHFVPGAVDSHSKELISIRTTYPGMPITLVFDNARYQHCAEVKAKAATLDMELLFLPACSPSLNLIERVWQLVRKRCLTNHYCDSFTRFRSAIDACLDNLAGPALPELQSLLTLNFQFFASPKS